MTVLFWRRMAKYSHKKWENTLSRLKPRTRHFSTGIILLFWLYMVWMRTRETQLAKNRNVRDNEQGKTFSMMMLGFLLRAMSRCPMVTLYWFHCLWLIVLYVSKFSSGFPMSYINQHLISKPYKLYTPCSFNVFFIMDYLLVGCQLTAGSMIKIKSDTSFLSEEQRVGSLPDYSS